MSKSDWYRNEVWGPQIETEFFSKLSRARSQRDQYLKIQILYLLPSCPGDALRLCEHYRNTKTVKTWDLDVTSYAAKAYEKLGKIEYALESYREVLRHNESESWFPHSVLLDAPFLIAGKGRFTDFPFALETLNRVKQNLLKQGVSFPVDRFILHASHALIRKRTGQKQEAIDHARVALNAARVADSGLRYHRSVGLVGSEHQSTIFKLKSITTGYPTWILHLISKIPFL
jgi:tetratricopeptide (TPR) repeat protein